MSENRTGFVHYFVLLLEYVLKILIIIYLDSEAIKDAGLVN